MAMRDLEARMVDSDASEAAVSARLYRDWVQWSLWARRRGGFRGPGCGSGGGSGALQKLNLRVAWRGHGRAEQVGRPAVGVGQAAAGCWSPPVEPGCVILRRGAGGRRGAGRGDEARAVRDDNMRGAKIPAHTDGA